MHRTFRSKLGVILGIGTLAALGACDRDSSKRAASLAIGRPLAAAPMELRVAFTYDRKNYNGPADSVRVSGAVRQPVAIALPGCGFGVWGADAPHGTLMISVDEDPDLLDRPTVMEACLAGDGKALEAALSDDLDFMISRLARLDIADTDRVVIVASGDAVPVVATRRVQVRGKILIGDPCLVPWRRADIDTTVPTTLLRGDPFGLGWTSIEQPSLSPGRMAKTEAHPRGAIAGMTRPCPALRRPQLPANVTVSIWPGEIETARRPGGMLEAERDAFRTYVEGS
jgi:hypothetical protein